MPELNYEADPQPTVYSYRQTYKSSYYADIYTRSTEENQVRHLSIRITSVWTPTKTALTDN